MLPVKTGNTNQASTRFVAGCMERRRPLRPEKQRVISGARTVLVTGSLVPAPKMLPVGTGNISVGTHPICYRLRLPIGLESGSHESFVTFSIGWQGGPSHEER